VQPTGGNPVGDTVGDRTSLAGAGAREHAHGGGEVACDLTLLGVERGEDLLGVHRGGWGGGVGRGGNGLTYCQRRPTVRPGLWTGAVSAPGRDASRRAGRGRGRRGPAARSVRPSGHPPAPRG